MRDSSSGRRRLPFSGGRSPLSWKGLRWFELDWHVLVIAGALLALGVVFVHAMAAADEVMERSSVSFDDHLKKLLFGLPALAIGLALRPRWLRRNAWAIYTVFTGILLLLPFIGTVRNGARRWIHLPGLFDLQPSELTKIALVLALARVLYRNRLERLRDWGPPLAAALFPMALVAKQPDLGTAMSFVPIALGMLYLAGAKGSVIVRFLLGAALIGGLACQFQVGVKGYQVQRLDTWSKSFRADDLIAERNGPAFHSYHARVAIGNGGMFGTGIGDGVANRTGILPERDCDSVFAVVA